MPLFEAISNAIDAIADRKEGYTKHSINITLKFVDDLVTRGGDTTKIFDGFIIEDEGVGFNKLNMAYFKQAHTKSKIKMGGKGVGRFTYLKVFSKVQIKSVFEQDGKNYLREFEFSLQNEFGGSEKLTETNDSIKTTLTMQGAHADYRKHWPSDPHTIAERIISHFLIRFASLSCPKIVLITDGHESIDLQQLFKKTISHHIEEKSFTVQGYVFNLQAFKNKDGRASHWLHLCALGRDVHKSKLQTLLPELPNCFAEHSDDSYTLIILITSEYLDNHANQERTKIAFQNTNDADTDDSLVSRHALDNAIIDTLRPILSSDLVTTNANKMAEIEVFVQQAPEYRVLTNDKYRPLLEQRIQPGLSGDKLDEALLHIRREVEDSVRKEERQVTALMESSTYEAYQEKMQHLMEDLNDVGKAKLAEYVMHRRIILDLMSNSLKRVRTDEKYPYENVLHKMIFPMGYTSKDIFFEQQNLWIIDERLCFHTLLTSDKKLKSVSGLENTSGKEPDIFSWFYDTPIGIAEEGDLKGGCVAIIEFKRPGRNDYDRDPIDQIIQRFTEISKGGVQDIEGLQINPEGLRYVGYLIADLTPNLVKWLEMKYHRSSDNEGFYCPMGRGNGYVEVISYNKMINDATRRNRILFEKLGVHKSNQG